MVSRETVQSLLLCRHEALHLIPRTHVKRGCGHGQVLKCFEVKTGDHWGSVSLSQSLRGEMQSRKTFSWPPNTVHLYMHTQVHSYICKIFNMNNRGAKLVLQVKAFAAKPEDLSSIPITFRIKSTAPTPKSCCLTSLYAKAYISTWLLGGAAEG